MEAGTAESKNDIQILIVEDSATQAERLRLILERSGYRVTAVRNGKEAIAALDPGQLPSLIVSDIVMPEMDGYQLCDFVKKDAAFKRTPVILLTSLTDPVDVMKGLECGADNFIFKPYDEQYLLARISFALANRHLRENDVAQLGLEILFAGQRYFITSDRMQILNLLLSTYEAAIEKNRELIVVTAELEAKNALLGTEVAMRKETEEALTKAKTEAERANAAKSDFMSHMSHELRTPLNAVIGYAQLLQMQSEDADTLASAKSILKGGFHLLELVNEVLDLARIEAGKLTLSLESVPMAGAISQAIEMVKPIADDRGVSMEISTELCASMHARADRQRLVQVLLNLLTNAVKYNRPSGHIAVQCSSDSNLIRLEVTDSGNGISEGDLARLFQPFERLGDQSAQGTGIGLVLSRRLMELMGGKLFLVNTGESGSTFAIELQSSEAPEVRVSENGNGHRTIVHHPGPGLRIAYIEDNLANLQLMERVLETIGGIELITAMQATMGLMLIEDAVPDLVLLDVHLPDGEGIDVLARLKSNPKTAEIPVVMISADATKGQIQRHLDAGAKSYLTKPLDLDILFAELNDLKKNSDPQ